jgi:archaellum component FlaC
MDDVRRIVNMLEWNDENLGWTLEQSVDAEISNLSADKEETEEKLNRINARIKALKTWKEGS